MGAALCDTALIEPDDTVGVFHGRQSMCDDEGGLGVDAGSGFVEDEQARVSQQRPHKAAPFEPPSAPSPSPGCTVCSGVTISARQRTSSRGGSRMRPPLYQPDVAPQLSPGIPPLSALVGIVRWKFTRIRLAG